MYGENKMFFIRTFSTTDATEVKAPKIFNPISMHNDLYARKYARTATSLSDVSSLPFFPHSCANNNYIPESRFVMDAQLYLFDMREGNIIGIA